MHYIYYIFITCCLAPFGGGICQVNSSVPDDNSGPSASIMVIGIAQDAGYPQIGCTKKCCQQVWNDCAQRQMVSCLVVLDHENSLYYLLDATPDIKDQMHLVESQFGYALGGILLTHAHIGHYTGLMDLGHEAMGAKGIRVWAMPRMYEFLSTNGPWSQLVAYENIVLNRLENEQALKISQNLTIVPNLVPHRDEYSETVGFLISGQNRSAWFIPDIDKWSKWDHQLKDELKHDYLFIDGTFYADGEIPGRSMDQIPHPFISETMALLADQPMHLRSRIHFIHFNHTNPVLWDDAIRKEVIQKGFRLAEEGAILNL